MAGSAATTQNAFSSVEALLGGPRVLRAAPRTSLDWVALIRQGMPAAAVDHLLDVVQMSRADFADVLGIPERTLARRKREGTLTTEESAKLLRLARVIVRATEVFEDAEAALDWLRAPNASLKRKTPLSLMDTDIGAESIFDMLGRIEHGVFA